MRDGEARAAEPGAELQRHLVRRQDKRMETAPSRFSVDLASASRIALAVAVGVLGVVMAHYPMIFSGFARIQTDLGDTRLIHYLLEHGYRWVRREPLHLDFWSPPFFYPAQNAAAYSDVLLGVGPVYWLWRALGASPDLSVGLWMISMSALNYAAGLLLFRKGLGFGMPAAVAAASLTAFGAPRVNQMGHQQLLPFFYPLLSLYALTRLFGDLSLGRRARAGYWLLAMAGVVAQLYAGVYLGWFLIVGLGLAVVVALALPACRGVLLAVVRRDAWAIVAAGAGGALLLQPFLSHYPLAAREVQAQYAPILRAFHPSVGSWFDVGPNNWFWGWTSRAGWAHKYEFLEEEHHLGLGFLTPIASFAGLYLGWKRPICRLAAVTAFIAWFAITYIPGDLFAMMAAGVVYYCAAGLFHEVDEPAWRAVGLAVVVCLLLLIRFPNPYLMVLGLSTIILCLLEIARTRDNPRGWILPGVALAGLSQRLFGLEVIPYGVGIIAPVAALLAYYGGRRRRWEAGFASLVLFMLFLLVITFVERPRFLIGAVAAASIPLAATAPRRYRPPAWLLLRAMLIALTLLIIFYNHDSLWLAYSGMIPGAVAIRALGRVVLILLVPAALGLACLVEFLDQRRWTFASWTVVLVCLAEQGVTTETYDAAANRASIANLASQIDRGRATFYYHPVDGLPFYRHHLDAMWASMLTGVPTVNGYSGHAPRSWHGFFRADFDPEIDVKSVLAKWEQSHGLPPNHVQWIGRDLPATSPSETRKDTPR